MLRQGIVYYGGAAWTNKHDVWLRGHTFVPTGLQVAFDSSYEAMRLTADRRDRPDVAIVDMALNSEFTDVVRKLSCLRGVSTLTAFGLAVEIGDWNRFTGATIGAYLGLVPTEHSSGGSRSQGSITKTGNTHARRLLLVEAAWHHRKTYRTPGAVMRARWDQAPAAARLRGHEGNQRLYQRWQAFDDRKKKPVIANVAIASELTGWVLVPGCPGIAAGAQVPDKAEDGRSAWNDPRKDYEQPPKSGGHARSLDQRKRSSRTARPAVSNPRIFPRKRERPPSLTARRQRHAGHSSRPLPGQKEAVSQNPSRRPPHHAHLTALHIS